MNVPDEIPDQVHMQCNLCKKCAHKIFISHWLNYLAIISFFKFKIKNMTLNLFTLWVSFLAQSMG